MPEDNRVLRDEVMEFQNIAGRNIAGINTWSAPVQNLDMLINYLMCLMNFQ